jgi:hypothetical protein
MDASLPWIPAPHPSSPMSASESFAHSLRGIIAELDGAEPSHTHLNRAAIDVDRLGRHLGGLGLANDREIGRAFTGAIAALASAHPVAQDKRADAVDRALAELRTALAHAENGTPHPPSRKADAERP